MSDNEVLIDYKKIYNEYVDKIERRLIEIAEKIKPARLNEAYRYVAQGGGKRLRPVLTMITCGAVNGDVNEAIDAGVAIEIMHNFTLIHDDIMDSSPKRRGRETVHKKWDEATAILIGDLMIGHAFSLLPKLDEHPRAGNILDAFEKGLIKVCEGQGYDMEFNERDDISLEDYLKMIDKKTAKLLETSAVICAELGYGEKSQIETLRQYANSLGIAFQIQDDLLDLTGAEIDFGKKTGQDIIEGKKTYLILKALQKAETKEHKDLLGRFIRDKGLPEQMIPKIINVFLELEVFEDAQSDIDIHLNNARTKLGYIEPGIHKEMLHWILESVNKRKQ